MYGMVECPIAWLGKFAHFNCASYGLVQYPVGCYGKFMQVDCVMGVAQCATSTLSPSAQFAA